MRGDAILPELPQTQVFKPTQSVSSSGAVFLPLLTSNFNVVVFTSAYLAGSGSFTGVAAAFPVAMSEALIAAAGAAFVTVTA